MVKGTLVDHLKKALKSRGVTYRDLARELGMSEAGVKRAFSRGSFTIQRFEEICRLLGLTLVDLAKAAEMEIERDTMRVSVDQELELASDDKVFCFCYLILTGLQPAQIIRHFDFTPDEAARLVTRLSRAKLIERTLGDEVRPLKSPGFIWSEGGPLATKHWPLVRQEFLDWSFQGAPASNMTFFSDSLSPSSVALLRKKIDRLVHEFHELAHMDRMAGEAEREQIWFLTAYRPWIFSAVSRYRRSKL